MRFDFLRKRKEREGSFLVLDIGNKKIRTFIQGKAKENNNQDYKKLPILVRLSPHVLKNQVVEFSFERNKNSKISKIEESDIFQRILKQTKKEISQNFTKDTGILSKDIHWIGFNRVDARINGYPVAKLSGLEGKYLEFKISAAFLPEDYFKNIEKSFENLGLKISNIIDFKHYDKEIL